MDEEELRPRARLAQDRPLEDFSVDELKAYAEKLESELQQVRSTIEGKESYLSGAESLFKG